MKRPKGRTFSEFEPLSAAEDALLRACELGEIAEVSPECPESAQDENTVRAGLVAFLAMGGDESAPVHHRGVRLRGAWVVGDLNLRGAMLPFDLSLDRCQLAGARPNLRDAEINGSVFLSGSVTQGLNLDGAVVKGDIFLREGFKASGDVSALGVELGGSLECSGAQLDGQGGDALSLDGAVVKGDVFLRDGFKASGTVRLLGVQLGGDLDCSGAELDGQGGDALSLDRAMVHGSVFFNDGFRAIGEVRALGAQLGGNLECSGAQLDGQEGKALSLDGTAVKGSVFFDDGFMANGEVRLLGAQLGGSFECGGAQLDGQGGKALFLDGAVIKRDVLVNDGFMANGEVRAMGVQLGGNFNCSGAQLDGKGGDALSLDGSVVNRNVFINEGFKASGTVRLLSAQLGGDLDCSGAQLGGQGGKALSLDGAVIKGNVFLGDGFVAKGEVGALGAQLGGNFECSGAQLDGVGGDAVSLDGAVIRGSVFFNGGIKASGSVRLVGAQLGGDLDCSDAQLGGGENGRSLSLEGTQVAGTLILRRPTSPLEGVNLAGCRVERLVDEADIWGSELRLDGFVYARLAGAAPVDAGSRIAWLRKQHSGDIGSKLNNGRFKPQPWLQLQKVLREMGHLEDARQVAIAFEDHHRKIGLVGQTPVAWPAWRRIAYGKTSVALHWAFKILIGYGYRPLRLVGWMFVVWILSAAVFWFAALQGAMGPGNPLVFNDPKLRTACASNWYLCSDLPEEFTGFSPLAYSLDVLLPLVNLEQEKDWAPLIPTPKPLWWQEWLTNWSLKHFARLVVWAEILFGWIASLLLVAVFSGLTKRREE